MAKLRSSSCTPLLQGMVLLALLLLASIQGAVMAQEQAVKQIISEFGDHVGVGVDVDVAGKLRNQGAKTFLTSFCQKPGWERFCKGAKKGIKVHRYLCKAQGWMDKQNPGGASGTSDFAVDILGGDLLSKSFPTLSCSVTSNSVVPCCSADQPQVQAAGTTMFPSRYPPATRSVRITRIRVGQEEIPVQPPAHLSSTLPPAYTDTEISFYGFLLRGAVSRTMKALAKPIPTADADQLCYVVPKFSLPRIAILLGSDMQTTELSVDATGTVWHQEYSMFCLGIRRTLELILGTP